MNLFRSNATLKPLKAHKGKRSELAAYSKKTLATLGTGSMKQAVQLPQGENLNEWLAVNTVGQTRASECAPTPGHAHYTDCSYALARHNSCTDRCVVADSRAVRCVGWVCLQTSSTS